jgi:hydrogenase expression/formation protein HypE
VIPPEVDIHPRHAHPGDVILVNGPIAQHGIAIMSVREGLQFDTTITSDTAALSGLVEAMLAAAPGIHVLRDPTRGGLASTLNEIAGQAGVGMVLQEDAIPIDEQVRAACELLGFDPLYVANEGKLIAIVDPADGERVLSAMQAHPLGTRAAAIGEVAAGPAGIVTLKSSIGSSRIVDMLSGEQLPRIC